MATKLAQMQYSDIPELKKFILNDVSRTGTTLGRGSFGVVEELKMGGTLCAGKRLHPELLNICNEKEGMKRTIKRFIEECSLMSKMLHPRIVQFMGLCFFDNNPFPMLVMEKLDVNLETILEMHKNIPFPLILHILQDIAEGLIYLHNLRPPIIHRDLTARNVLVNRGSFKAKIGDLGNARLCLADHTKFTHTLTQAPGTLSYMPPEALASRPTYDGRLDMFSFGHLALFAIIQDFPKDLEAPTYYDENGDFKGRNEVERREKYIKKLVAKLTKDHVVTKVIFRCLHNLPQNRPTAKEVMEQITGISPMEDDAYGQVDLVELINKVDKGESKAVYYDTTGDQSMKRRIESFKKGTPGLLEIFRIAGGKFSRKHTWKSHVFKIQDGALTYYRQDMMEKPHDFLNLSSIVGVKACPPKEIWNKSKFYFEVHFSDIPGSPWHLRAHTQDDRTCWMETILAGSSAVFKPATPDPESHYEPVTPIPEDETVYSYARMSRSERHHQAQERKELKSLYDDPDAPAMIQAQIPSQSPPITTDKSPAHLKQPSQANAKRARSKSPAKKSLSVAERLLPGDQKATVPPISSPQHAYITVPDDKEAYDTVDATAGTESTEGSEYEDMSQQSLPLQVKGPQRSITVPKELSALAELSTENLPNMNPSEAQLWMLNQMQKLVEKFVGVYESTVVGPLPKETKSNRGKLLPAQTEEVYDDAQSLPPVPPRTYSCTVQKTYQEESSISSRTISRHSKTVNGGNKPPPPSTERSPHHLIVTGPPPLRPKPDLTVAGRGSHLVPVAIKQKREATHAEMISTLKARNKNLSSEITSHLVTDNDSRGNSANMTRPEWTRAKTQSSQLAELSLADLEQKALFLPRSALSENLEEIGHGQFGKIFKGIYRRTEGEGLPVAIKTIKKYESEKERHNFQKEMTVMSKLIHPNIVRLFGLVQQDQPWIVLEFLSHGDLKRFLTKKKQPVNKLIKYMLDIATGMHYISEKGLIHRDLAARNVMISQDEICKVGDFGLLREIPKDADIYVSKTKTPFPIRWMAPESHLRKEFSPATDVWSFGVVMWEMHNPTELPYKGLSNTEVSANVCTGTSRLEIPKSYPPTVMRIMKACWQLEPSERPSFLLIAMLLTNVVFGTD